MAPGSSPDPSRQQSPNRRNVLQAGAAVLLGSTLGCARPLLAAEPETPPRMKQTGLTADQMLEKIKEDFQQRQYYVTGMAQSVSCGSGS